VTEPVGHSQRLLTGWGRTAPSSAALVHATASEVPELVARAGGRGLIARGLGRSYGDAAQNAGGAVLMPLPEAMTLDRGRAVVELSAGTSLDDLIRFLLPQGFFVPVTPGTRYVTVGGAVAADIHGKNHHRVGSIGSHVVSLDLVSGDARPRTIGPDDDAELFWATVGGMGLTGVITAVTLRVLPVESGFMSVNTERLDGLDAVMDRMREADRDSTYSVAWIDTLARGAHLGRSVLTTGEHALKVALSPRLANRRLEVPSKTRLGVPDLLPGSLISKPTVRLFNEAWFRKAPRSRGDELQSIATFFHPLDGVANWNRLYGRVGVVQYQFVVPDTTEAALPDLVELIARAGHPSFLAVLKRFGPGNPGLLSFPMEGWTLALDVPAREDVGALFADLDRRVVAAGGRVYLAKDSRLPVATLEAMYPRLEEFREVRRQVDPRGVFQSDLSRRLGL
jgi:decaprenylphospho-beta-D-ribofuranose 2-oxidase